MSWALYAAYDVILDHIPGNSGLCIGQDASGPEIGRKIGILGSISGI